MVMLKCTRTQIQKGYLSILIDNVKNCLATRTLFSIYMPTVLPAKSDSDFMFCLQSYQGITCVFILSSG